MIFSPKPREFYAAGGFGLAYQNLNNEEWNLAALTSRLLYAYESELGPDEKAGEFDPEQLRAVQESMQQIVGGETVEWYMQCSSPFVFLEALENNPDDTNELPINKYWDGWFMDVVKARVFTWRGAHRREGNRIMPRLTEDQLDLIEKVANG